MDIDLLACGRMLVKGNSSLSRQQCKLVLLLITAYEQIHRAGWLHLTTKPIKLCIGEPFKLTIKFTPLTLVEHRNISSKMNVDVTVIHRSMLAVLQIFLRGILKCLAGSEMWMPAAGNNMMSLELMLMYLGGNRVPWARIKRNWIYSLQLHETTLWESLLVSAWRMKFDDRAMKRGGKVCGLGQQTERSAIGRTLTGIINSNMTRMEGLPCDPIDLSSSGQIFHCRKRTIKKISNFDLQKSFY